MEYLRPLENLENKVALYRKVIIGLFSLLAIALVAVPQAARKSNPLLIRTEKGLVLSEVEPWKLSVARVEEFSKAYLADRFTWSESDFGQKRTQLSQITEPLVMTKLKDSLQAFEAMTHNEKARSYYVLEDFHFSNEQKKVSIQMTRVLRIRSAALSTPLRIELTYSEAPLTAENPYGLVIDTLNEQEVTGQ
jgi:hypothetical protein